MSRWVGCLAVPLALAGCRERSEPPARAAVTPSAPWVALLPGDTLRLTAAATDTLGNTLVRPAVEWTSSDPAVAGVTAGGLVRAAGLGTATITARVGPALGRTTVVVAPPVLVGAGDIAVCGRSGDEATAAILDTTRGVVFTVGDHAYPNGRARDFAECYEPSWGRHKRRTRPAPGNHDYRTPGAAAYYAYFGPLAGDSGVGYYSWDFAGWHLVALNSEVPMARGSPQEQWLRRDLAGHPARCTLAYWHSPRFSSGERGNDPATEPLWQALFEAHADVVIVGHDHTYERFAPQTPEGRPDSTRGIRQFVVGTGGAAQYRFAGVQPNSEVRDNVTIGVLRLTLRPTGYDWRFVPAGDTFTDSGTAICR